MRTIGAGRRVLAVVPDLMDRSRLATGGVEVESVRAAGLAAAIDRARAEGTVTAVVVVVDLSRPDVLEAVSGLDVDRRDLTVVGFAPHVDDELLHTASAAGVLALPRSKFFARWPDTA